MWVRGLELGLYAGSLEDPVGGVAFADFGGDGDFGNAIAPDDMAAAWVSFWGVPVLFQQGVDFALEPRHGSPIGHGLDVGAVFPEDSGSGKGVDFWCGVSGVVDRVQHYSERGMRDFFLAQPVVGVQKPRSEAEQFGTKFFKRVGLDHKTTDIAAMHGQRAVFMNEEGHGVLVLAHRFSPAVGREQDLHTRYPP